MAPDKDDPRLVALYEDHYDAILAYCVRRIGHEDAEEATSEVFVVAWKRIDEVDWSTVRPWLYGIARRVLANRWRSIRRRRRLQARIESVVGPRPDEEALDVVLIGGSEHVLVMEALESLKTADREILRLAAWEELTASEAATALGISPSAAEQRLYRAKRRFARVLDRLSTSEFSIRAADGEEVGDAG